MPRAQGLAGPVGGLKQQRYRNQDFLHNYWSGVVNYWSGVLKQYFTMPLQSRPNPKLDRSTHGSLLKANQTVETGPWDGVTLASTIHVDHMRKSGL